MRREVSAKLWSRHIATAIFVSSRTPARSDSRADPDILAVAGDIGDPITAERIVSQAIERFGRVDTLVNNAGIFIGKPFTEYTATTIPTCWRSTSAASTSLSVLSREMLKRGSGHIVQITSSLDENVSSRAPSALAALTKGGLNAATKSLAVEYASREIRVNAVAPGATKTSMHAPEMYEFPGRSCIQSGAWAK